MTPRGRLDQFWELLAVYFLLVLEEVGIPLPFVTPGVMVALSVQWRQGELPLWAILLTAASASATGTLLLYMAGRYGARPLMLQYGPWAGLSEERVLRLEDRLRGDAFWAILSARFVPGMTAASSVLAGTLRMPVPVVLAAGQIASMAWTLFWVTGGNLGFGLVAPFLTWLPQRLQAPAAILALSLSLAALVWVIRRAVGVLLEEGRGLFPPSS